MDAKNTGELIAARRRELGWSQEELAARLHVTDKAVSKWETGRGMPGIESLEPLAEALDLSVSEILSGRRLTEEELPKAAEQQVMESMERERARPCLYYHIKMCSAPCVRAVTKEEYALQVDLAKKFLNGQTRQLVQELQGRLKEAASQLLTSTGLRPGRLSLRR